MSHTFNPTFLLDFPVDSLSLPAKLATGAPGSWFLGDLSSDPESELMQIMSSVLGVVRLHGDEQLLWSDSVLVGEGFVLPPSLSSSCSSVKTLASEEYSSCWFLRMLGVRGLDCAVNVGE